MSPEREDWLAFRGSSASTHQRGRHRVATVTWNWRNAEWAPANTATKNYDKEGDRFLMGLIAGAALRVGAGNAPRPAGCSGAPQAATRDLRIRTDDRIEISSAINGSRNND